MAIDTATKKLAMLELEIPWEPGLPLSPGATPFDQGEQQQLLWGYPGLLWGAPAAVLIVIFGTWSLGPAIDGTWAVQEVAE